MGKKKAEEILKGVAITGATVGGVSMLGNADIVYAEAFEDTMQEAGELVVESTPVAQVAAEPVAQAQVVETASVAETAPAAESAPVVESTPVDDTASTMGATPIADNTETNINGEGTENNPVVSLEENVDDANGTDAVDSNQNENFAEESAQASESLAIEDSQLASESTAVSESIASEDSQLASESQVIASELASEESELSEQSTYASESLSEEDEDLSEQSLSASIALSEALESEASASASLSEALASQEQSVSIAMSEAESEYYSASTSFSEAELQDQYLENLINEIEAARADLQDALDVAYANGGYLNHDATSNNFYGYGDILANKLIQYKFYQEGYVGEITYSQWDSSNYTTNSVKVKYLDSAGQTKYAYFDYVTVDENGEALVPGITIPSYSSRNTYAYSDAVGIMVVQKSVKYTSTSNSYKNQPLTWTYSSDGTVCTYKVGNKTVDSKNVTLNSDGSYTVKINGLSYTFKPSFVASEDQTIYKNNLGEDCEGNFGTKGYYYYSEQDFENGKDDYHEERSEITSRSISYSEIASESTTLSESVEASLSNSASASEARSDSLSASASASQSASEARSDSLSESAENSESSSQSRSDSMSESAAESESASESRSESISESLSDSNSKSEERSESISDSLSTSASQSKPE